MKVLIQKHQCMMAKQSNVAQWPACRNWGNVWIDAQWLHFKLSFGDLLRSGFTVIGNPQPLYYKNIAMHEQQTQIIISLRGLNVTE